MITIFTEDSSVTFVQKLKSNYSVYVYFISLHLLLFHALFLLFSIIREEDISCERDDQIQW